MSICPYESACISVVMVAPMWYGEGLKAQGEAALVRGSSWRPAWLSGSVPEGCDTCRKVAQVALPQSPE